MDYFILGEVDRERNGQKQLVKTEKNREDNRSFRFFSSNHQWNLIVPKNVNILL